MKNQPRNPAVSTAGEIGLFFFVLALYIFFHYVFTHISERTHAANIQNALPYLYTPEVDCQTVANGMKNYRTAWKNMRERHTGVPAFHKKANNLSYQTNCHYVSSDGGSMANPRFHVNLDQKT
jgi:hypothetical protein